MMFLKFIIALVPTIWLMLALGKLKVAGYQACLIAFAVTAVLALIFWKQSPDRVGSAALEGVLNALWPICLVIVAALFTYYLTLRTKAMDAIKLMLSHVSTDQRVVLLIVGWGFGAFMEGMAGFGTAVAIPAGILIALGMDPVRTVVACLVANSMPTAFGSVGIPTVTLSSVTGLSVKGLSADTAIIEFALMFLTPFLMVCIIGGGIKALRGALPATFVAVAAYTVPVLLTGMLVGPELPDIIGSICCMACLVGYSKWHSQKEISAPEEYRTRSAGTRGSAMTLRAGVIAWLPFLLIFIFLLLTSLVAPIHDTLSSVASDVQIYSGPHANVLHFSWINTPGVIIFIAAVIGGLVQHATFADMGSVLKTTIVENWKTLVTICSVMALAKIMSYSGMISDIATMLVVATSVFFPLVSPLIGVLGGFVTGSGTSTTVLFGGMQAEAAKAIHLSPAWIASANTMGAGIGKMICPQSIAIGAAAAGITGRESSIMGQVMKYCVLYFVIGGLICFFLPGLGII